MLTIIGIVWGSATVVIMLVFAFANGTYSLSFRGQKKPVNAFALQIVIAAMLAAFLLITIVPHLLCRFVGLRGFFGDRTKDYTMRNPFKRIRRGG